ncbi:hypothetical protein FGU71_05790 [Erythrobacter insulae]|uniref:Hyaluronidase n=1 Tax=Erythrobacter insulae TaxID=2584124 RepID=A0A547PBK6_9SPHN|nr:hypothetical protein [Erythrobacter insulae]TRD11414.1 hypothetical protein FGU71_05790 [Erythrobacter insulae]
MRNGYLPPFQNVSRREFGFGASALGASALARCPAFGQTAKFKVFDELLYPNKPDLAQFGISPIHIIDRGIWPKDTSHFEDPDPELVAKKLASLPDDGTPVVMDFEFYSFSEGQAKASEAVQGLSKIAATFHQADKDRAIGFYGYMPVRDYWRAVKPKISKAYKSWQDENSMSAALAPDVDFLAPSIYTFYNSPSDWRDYALAQISEARRISDKPVYAFLWPNFHDQGIRKQPPPIPPEFWRLQLDTMASVADGIVLWGGWDFGKWKSMPWNDEAPWWIETRKFLETL